MLRVLAILCVLLTFASETFARERQREFRRGRGGARGNEQSRRVGRVPVGALQHAGNGCPAGTMRAVFSEDSLSFTLIFDQFIAEIKEGSNARRDSMACDALIPVQIPEGTQMEISRVDFRGFSALPQGAAGELTSTFNFYDRGSGDRDRLNLRFRFNGPTTENYELSSDVLTGGDSEVSPCGGATTLRIRNQLNLTSRPGTSAAMVTLDSVDGSGHAVYQVNWRACQAARPDTRPEPPPRPPPHPVPWPGHGPRGR